MLIFYAYEHTDGPDGESRVDESEEVYIRFLEEWTLLSKARYDSIHMPVYGLYNVDDTLRRHHLLKFLLDVPDHTLPFTIGLSRIS